MIGVPSIESPALTGPTSFEAIVAGRSNGVFKAMLNKAAQDQDRETVRQAAAQLVSSTFVMPVTLVYPSWMTRKEEVFRTFAREVRD